MPQHSPVPAPQERRDQSAERQRSPYEVYADFYDKYGQEKETGPGFHAVRAGRVVHFDSGNRFEPEDRSMRLSVFEADTSKGQFWNVRSQEAQSYLHFSYIPEAFLVVTTDGKTIQEWRIREVYGTRPLVRRAGQSHPAQQDVPLEQEELHFSVVGPQGNRAELHLARDDNSVKSRMVFKNGDKSKADRLGWVVSAKDSLPDRERALRRPELQIGQLLTRKGAA